MRDRIYRYAALALMAVGAAAAWLVRAVENHLWVPKDGEFDVRRVDVLPEGSVVKLTKKRGEAIVGSCACRNSRWLCYDIKQGRDWWTVDAREIAEVISRPATRMTLVIETPKD